MTPEDLKKYAEEIANTNGYDWDEEIVLLAVDYLRILDKTHEAKEIYTGMDGFVSETAPEAYQQRILKKMFEALTND